MSVCFNEAAAYHCGKPSVASTARPDRRYASMRPQHITAENMFCLCRPCLAVRASMRPQHITAENRWSEADTPSPSVAASMRPQHITAENAVRRPARSPGPAASMRPQHITAENWVRGSRPPVRDAASMRPQHITAENDASPFEVEEAEERFNEAAAYHCGKPPAPRPCGAGRGDASMRPQHITAENSGAAADLTVAAALQ